MSTSLREVGHAYIFPVMIYKHWFVEKGGDVTEIGLFDLVKGANDEWHKFADARSSDDVVTAALAYMRTMYVLTWAVYETFIQDVAREVLNMGVPLASGKVLSEHLAKADLANWRASHPSMGLGDFIYEELKKPYGHAGSIKVIKSAKTIGDVLAVVQALNAPELALFEKRRHLAAHRLGIVDEKYVNEVSEIEGRAGEPITSLRGRAGLGDPVEVSPYTVAAGLEAAHKVAFELGVSLSEYGTAQNEATNSAS